MNIFFHYEVRYLVVHIVIKWLSHEASCDLQQNILFRYYIVQTIITIITQYNIGFKYKMKINQN